MNLSDKFKQKVRDAILEARENYSGSAASYSKKLGINNTVYSRIKKGEIDKVLKDSAWLSIGNQLGVSLKTTEYKVARTNVYDKLEDNLNFCKKSSTSMILVDDCGIGKTFCAKHIVRNMKDSFYFDCSQVKTPSEFTRAFAKTLGVDDSGRLYDVKTKIKERLNDLEDPLVILDEAGDFTNDNIYLLIKEFWNATEVFPGVNVCGWYMMGAEGLGQKFEAKMGNNKSGFAELFSRFSDEFVRLVPTGKEDRQSYYRQLLGDIASVYTKDAKTINKLVKHCLAKESEKSIRYLNALLKMELV